MAELAELPPRKSPPPTISNIKNQASSSFHPSGSSILSSSTSRPLSAASTGSSVSDRPWEQKQTVRCMFCRGNKCRRCGKDAYQLCEKPAIKRIHSSWITDDILAMQRPSDEHFIHHKFVEHLKENNIVAVFNLQEPGEHPFCGFGIKSSGFSYYPEKLMAAGSMLNC